MELLEQFDVLLEVLGPTVVMEADDIRLLDLNSCQRRHGLQRGPVPMPHATGQRLRRMYRSRPRKDLGKEGENDLVLVAGIALGVGAVVAVVGLVPEVPGENAGIISKSADDAFDIAFEARELRGVGEEFSAWRLNPAGVVDAGDGRMLRT